MANLTSAGIALNSRNTVLSPTRAVNFLSFAINTAHVPSRVADSDALLGALHTGLPRTCLRHVEGLLLSLCFYTVLAMISFTRFILLSTLTPRFTQPGASACSLSLPPGGSHSRSFGCSWQPSCCATSALLCAPCAEDTDMPFPSLLWLH